MKAKILVVDDDAALRRIIEYKLIQHGYAASVAGDGEEALALMRGTKFDLVLSDMKMPGLSGIELLEQSRQIQPETAVILMTAYAAISQAVQAIKMGAFDYLTKPFEDDQLLLTVQRAIRFRSLEAENRELKEQLKSGDGKSGMIGVSAPFKAMVTLVEKAAPTDATVLIGGESGTGKELVARTIHRLSPRGNNEFVAINCAAIPKELIESELFGHVRGAFTGAIKDKKGKFELAEGGTILLDEVGEVPYDLQAKLLRVLQEKVIEPVGSERPIEIDIRLIAATNVDLRERVGRGLFRDDLFYRLNVIPIRVPSLKERAEDIPLLVDAFLTRFARGQSVRVDADLIARLQAYSWPGNIRELENLIERMVILRSSDLLTAASLPSDFGVTHRKAEIPFGEHVSFHEAEKNLVLDALHKFGWNKAGAARYLSIPRHILIYRMKKYGLTGPEDSD
ncbi:DNA-binding response regulator [candidate division GN15 bacterium]|uniref:DNA-binding response regulator n=1 Tax=candidate division GN15 bacterium TaxID=2072418 RepID=A0A855X6C3_9BACT|nr:MAG: DNA-binding response regulator [candidate division GN15 bacterium]